MDRPVQKATALSVDLSNLIPATINIISNWPHFRNREIAVFAARSSINFTIVGSAISTCAKVVWPSTRRIFPRRCRWSKSPLALHRKKPNTNLKRWRSN